jgi:hypothetical protein
MISSQERIITAGQTWCWLCTDYQTIDDQAAPLTDEMWASIREANDI